MTAINIFNETARRRRVLSTNVALHGNGALIEAVAACVVVESYPIGSLVMEQGQLDPRIAFILTGKVSIWVRGRRVAERSAPQHVGEMAAIDPKAPRSATVRAESDVVVGWLDDDALEELGRKHSELWRAFARELADRLREREKLLTAPNLRPRLFIGSSVENLPAARAFGVAFDHDSLDVQPWNAGTFRPSHYTIPDLLAQVRGCDFALFCLGPDDKVSSRGIDDWAPRDNVVFESGLFVGALGMERVFLVKPRSAKLRLPSDLAGVYVLDYKLKDGDEPDVEATAHRIRQEIHKLGPR